MTAKYFAGVVLGDAARQHRAGGGFDVEREFAEHVADLAGVDVFRLDLREHVFVEGRAMRAGHRGVFGDGHRGVRPGRAPCPAATPAWRRRRRSAPSRRRSGAAARSRRAGGKPGQRQGGGEGAARDDQGRLPDWRVRAKEACGKTPFASLKRQCGNGGSAARPARRDSISLDRGAEPRQRGPQFLVLDRGQGFRDFRHRFGSGGARRRRAVPGATAAPGAAPAGRPRSSRRSG